MKSERPIIFKILAIIGYVAIAIGAFFYICAYFYGIFVAIAGFLITLYASANGDLKTLFTKRVKQFMVSASIPVIGIVAALIIGGILLAIAKYNPFTAYGALFYGGFVKNWSITILNAIPLLFTGLAVAFAFQAGLFNIGAEGQYYVGAMATAALGIYLNIPGILAIPLILLIGGLLSSAYVVIPAALKIKTGAHEVITTMMFAQIARLLSPLMIRSFGGDTSSAHPFVTDEILPQLFLPLLNKILPNTYYRLHAGIIIAIVAAIIVDFIIKKTTIGFEIRAVGQNKSAARVQGISVGKIYSVALLGSGFLAGLAGVVQVLGLDHKLYQNIDTGYGWNGISVALLANNKPIGVIFTAILWGALDAGGQYMQRNEGIPSSIVEIIKGIVLFLLVARYIYVTIFRKMKRKKTNG